MWIIKFECNKRVKYMVADNYSKVEFLIENRKDKNLNKVNDRKFFYYIGDDRIDVEVYSGVKL